MALCPLRTASQLGMGCNLRNEALAQDVHASFVDNVAESGRAVGTANHRSQIAPFPDVVTGQRKIWTPGAAKLRVDSVSPIKVRVKTRINGLVWIEVGIGSQAVKPEGSKLGDQFVDALVWHVLGPFFTAHSS